jgi:diguanylate cyclase (GGDEF)-like protein/PAS domain S-box-containing protein
MTLAGAPLADVFGDRDRSSGGMSERYDAIVESTNDSIIGTSLDGTILRWSAGAERMYGFSADEALGQRLSLIVPADRAGEALRVLHSLGSGARVDRLETVRVRRDGTRFDVSVTLSAIRDSSGAVVGALSIARDISESKDTEALLRANRRALADAHSFLEKAERLSRTGSWILELGDAPSLIWSKECYRVLGLDEDTAISVEGFFALVHPEDREKLNATMSLALAEYRAYELEHRIVCRDGSVRWLHVWGEPEYDESGEPLRVLGVAQDITERYAADEALRSSERRFRLLAENARDFIFRLALLPEHRFEYVSPASVAITGFTPEELYDDVSLATGLIAPAHVHEMESLADLGGDTEPIDVAVRRKDGTIVWVSEQVTFVRDDAGNLVAVEGIVRDITERKRAEDELAYAGLHDALTGLPNRSLLRDRLERARTRAHAEGHSVIALALDLDDFTLINDTHGRDTGDAVLVAVAALLTSASRDRATVARTGSDEFVVLGDDIGDDDAAAAFVERIRGALLQPIRINGIELFVQARIGVAVDEPAAATETLLRNADIALARAKQHRTGLGVEFFNSDMRTRTNERFALVGDLHRALQRDEFELRYQPIVRLADDRVVGAEALIRWRHPERGLISPAEFIPLAEDTGVIVDIGAWVLDRACAQLGRLSGADPALAELRMSVNVSVKQLCSPGIVNTVAEAVTRAGIEPGRLTIEMTESVFVDDLDAIRDVLTQLRAQGVRIAVDDFGTGYSSLAYLKHLPLDALKIDRNFIEGLGTDPCDEAIVASALSLSSVLGLLAVAEGVETREQLAVLRSLGCDAAQGFYFSEAVTGVELAALVVAPPKW